MVGETLNPACVPVPLKAIIKGEPVASLITVAVPVALPVVVGAKPTMNVKALEGLIVAGVVTPLTLNPVPVAAILETWTAALPVLVRVTSCVLLPPAKMFPKLTVEVLAVSSPVAAAVPVPLKAILNGESVASLVMVTFPVTLVVAVGAKVTVRVTVCDGLIVAGVTTPPALNSAPLTTTLEIWTAAVPVFVSVTGREELPPDVTLPKLKPAGLALS